MIDLVAFADRMAEQLWQWYAYTPTDEPPNIDRTLSLLREYWGEEELERRLKHVP